MSQLQESCHSPRMRHLGTSIVSGVGYPTLPNKRTLARLQLQFPYGSADGNLLWTWASEDDTAAPRRVFLISELVCITLPGPFKECTRKGVLPHTRAILNDVLVL